jgi:hypothetical protein
VNLVSEYGAVNLGNPPPHIIKFSSELHNGFSGKEIV